MTQPITVEPGTKVRLRDFRSRLPAGDGDKESARKEMAEHIAGINDLEYRLYAENRRALLVVLQGMDTAGKDGTIRAVMRGLNPQSCQVTSFKQPSVEELAHDFLWRIHRAAPRRGQIGIFNRSHYEDVLVVRVHNLVPKEEWKTRYRRINSFEKLMSASGTTILKFFLHVGKDEQRRRLQARLDHPRKRWKFSLADLEERRYWPDYQRAYEDVLTRCSTEHAPWHIIPADRKWYRNLLVSRIVHDALKAMDPQFPPPAEGLDGIVVE
ncbi:MAG: polyphosphate kinase 2 family protein [Pirellulales bacterium]